MKNKRDLPGDQRWQCASRGIDWLINVAVAGDFGMTCREARPRGPVVRIVAGDIFL